MRLLLWTEPALTAREEIVRFIADDDLAAALALNDRFDAIGEQLQNFPMSGRVGRVPGTRELVIHENYILVYTVSPDVVHILHVLHAARLWPSP